MTLFNVTRLPRKRKLIYRIGKLITQGHSTLRIDQQDYL